MADDRVKQPYFVDVCQRLSIRCFAKQSLIELEDWGCNGVPASIYETGTPLPRCVAPRAGERYQLASLWALGDINSTVWPSCRLLKRRLDRREVHKNVLPSDG